MKITDKIKTSKKHTKDTDISNNKCTDQHADQTNQTNRSVQQMFNDSMLNSLNNFMSTGELEKGCVIPPGVLLIFSQLQNGKQGEVAPNDLAGNINIGLPIDPCEILSVLPIGEIEYGDCEFPDIAGSASAEMINGHSGMLFTVPNDMPDAQKRFITAHMLGHFFLGHYSNDLIKMYETLDTVSINDAIDFNEKQACEYAADLLVPVNILDVLMQQRISPVKILETFCAPVNVIQHQAAKLSRKLPIFGSVESFGPSFNNISRYSRG